MDEVGDATEKQPTAVPELPFVARAAVEDPGPTEREDVRRRRRPQLVRGRWLPTPTGELRPEAGHPSFESVADGDAATARDDDWPEKLTEGQRIDAVGRRIGKPPGHRALLDLTTCLAGPMAGAAAAYALSIPADSAVENAALVLAVLVTAQTVLGRGCAGGRMLPLMGRVLRHLVPLSWIVLAVALGHLGALPGVGTTEAAMIVAAAAGIAAVARRLRRRSMKTPPVRIGVIGHSGPAHSLQRELALAGFDDEYQVIGRISFAGDPAPQQGDVPVIGHLGDLHKIMRRHDIDLLLLTGRVPRIPVFEEIMQSCPDLPVRLRELSSFYEEVFCHVAATEINAAWFQYVIHPKYRVQASAAERTLDVLVAALVGLVALPLLAVIALLIRRDGGPVLFRQERIGEGGRPFTIYKLRTMRFQNVDSSWAAEGDPRVTSIGRYLRRTHLDELPQLINVLRGEMSLVGPRPEQPQIVDELERTVAFYQRRHLVKPGITGWAQVRCGYAGSETGSAWKLCHDLYYLKHRSFWTNLLILAETVRVIVADPQYSAQPASVDFILIPQATAAEAVPAVTA